MNTMYYLPGNSATDGLRDHLPPGRPDHPAPVDLHPVPHLSPAERRVLLYGAVSPGVPAGGGEHHLALSLTTSLTPPAPHTSRGGAVTDQDWPPDFPHDDLTIFPGESLTVGLTLHHLLLPALGAQLQPHLLAVLPGLLGAVEELQEEEELQQDGRKPEPGHGGPGCPEVRRGTGRAGGGKLSVSRA